MTSDKERETLETPIPAPATRPQPKPGIPPGTPDWWGHPDAPWDTSTPELWVDAIDNISWQRDRDTFWKALSCPRCTHEIVFSLGGGLTEDFDEEPGGRSGALDQAFTPVRCTCETDKDAHPGRSDERKTGCGQNGWVKRP